MAIHFFKQNYANFVYLTDVFSYSKEYKFIDLNGNEISGYTPQQSSSYMTVALRYSRFMHGTYTVADACNPGNSVNLTEEVYTEGKTKYTYAHSKMSTLAVTATYAAYADGTYHTMLNITGYAKEEVGLKGIVLNRWVPNSTSSYDNSYSYNTTYWKLCPLGYIELDVPIKLEAEKTFAITVDIKI